MIDPTTVPQLVTEVAIIVPLAVVVWLIDMRHRAVARRRAAHMKAASHIALFSANRFEAGHNAWVDSDHRGANR